MHIDELEVPFLMCYILNPFVNYRFALTFVNTILVQPDIRQTTIIKYTFHSAQPLCFIFTTNN